MPVDGIVTMGKDISMKQVLQVKVFGCKKNRRYRVCWNNLDNGTLHIETQKVLRTTLQEY